MTIKLSVTYAATDGSMPEAVEVEWTDAAPEHATEGLLAVLERLLVAARQRYAVSVPEPIPDEAAEVSGKRKAIF